MTFAVGDDTLLELLLNLVGLLAGLLDFGVLVGGTDHVLKTHRRAGNRGELVAEALELVDSLNGDVVAGDLVAVENKLADRRLRALVVPEAHAFRPDVVEDNAAGGRFDRTLVGHAVGTARRAEVGVAVADARVIADRALCNAELHFADVVEKRQMFAGAVSLTRDFSGELILLRRNGEEVKSQADVLGRSHDGLARSG